MRRDEQDPPETRINTDSHVVIPDLLDSDLREAVARLGALHIGQRAREAGRVERQNP